MPKVTFAPAGLSVEVPRGTTLLQAAQRAHARMGSACGGNCACSTCHVYVQQGFSSLSPIEEKEEDILDKAFDVRATSRLGCQARIQGADVVLEVSPESARAWLDEHPAERGDGKPAG